MSLPRNTPNTAPPPSHSSSPSKSSLRRVSGGATNLPAARSLLPSPHFEEPPAVISSVGHESPNPELSALQQEPQVDEQQPPHPFQPFFTLIEDTLTHEHFHPTVHYIFADDDADIITEAALRSLEQTLGAVAHAADESATSSTPYAGTAQAEHGTSTDPDNRYLPPSRHGVNEHYLVLDIAPVHQQQQQAPPTSAPTASLLPTEASTTGNLSAGGSTSSATAPTTFSGYEVTNAYSMSADWQVMRTGITAAPTLGDDEEGEGLMLRVEGRRSLATGSEGEGGEDERVEEMIERFERGLEEVRSMLIAGAGMVAVEGQVEGGGEAVDG